ncbi:MAG: hypothetical protein KAV42_00220 [Candidatus Krumholzibacteria bacterium]|nr:hypothetical protein [Candidatus Krumholzibacteria bacterium]
MFVIKKISIFIVVVSIFGAFVSGMAAAEIPQTFYPENGIKAVLYPPSYIMETMTCRDECGRLMMVLPDGSSYILVEDISDPVIVNKGDGSFHPAAIENITTALAEIDVDGVMVDLALEIFILPLPRRFVPGSTAVGNRIFISPGVYDISIELAAYTITHEVGHCVQNLFISGSESREWLDYLTIRDLLDETPVDGLMSHMYLPEEIFAEDFRYLFGGEASNYSGTIENPYIALPDEVPELATFFVTLIAPIIASVDADVIPEGKILSAMNYPNPFNPVTTIKAQLDPSVSMHEIEVNIYGVDGSLIRRLFSGDVSGGEFSVRWDGRTDRGTKVPSGAYLYAIRSGTELRTGKMIMMR